VKGSRVVVSKHTHHINPPAISHVLQPRSPFKRVVWMQLSTLADNTDPIGTGRSNMGVCSCVVKCV
jgi:1-acyl-sn-glycerol-3-phosphate acyltransferase